MRFEVTRYAILWSIAASIVFGLGAAATAPEN